ncbi:MAG TPA: DUF192 domain-containing protein [Phenylobacterium sp.]|uniref:DUF192 domain-containing protein n=1 Tax=Phenylobacterium sp. TaxID=1871053 RepID=UPI002B5AFB7C|nr:DUF192 domain-containing protein [Phenylobacterium sp.]HSV04328.1 DUF192 domain-containing protein [Phenylobacterium sp.]
MVLQLTEQRSRLALAVAFGLAAIVLAPAARSETDIPRMDPDRCHGQAVIAPLQPLTIVTARGPARFKVEVAQTERQHAYGLMCRRRLAPDRGMLFDFHAPADGVNFWMRNTLIGLDIVYIAPNGKVLSVARNAAPLDETPIPAGGTIRAVLEIPAGRAAQLGVKPGDKVIDRIFTR